MKGILLFTIASVLFFTIGYLDGYFKKYKTANHAVKWIVWIAILLLSIWKVSMLSACAMCLIIKPWHDFGYTNAISNKILVIGKTSWTDRIVRKIFRVRGDDNSDVRFLHWAYLIVIFISALMMLESVRIESYLNY